MLRSPALPSADSESRRSQYASSSYCAKVRPASILARRDARRARNATN
jgi:hypothetical protein